MTLVFFRLTVSVLIAALSVTPNTQWKLSNLHSVIPQRYLLQWHMLQVFIGFVEARVGTLKHHTLIIACEHRKIQVQTLHLLPFCFCFKTFVLPECDSFTDSIMNTWLVPLVLCMSQGMDIEHCQMAISTFLYVMFTLHYTNAEFF